MTAVAKHRATLLASITSRQRRRRAFVPLPRTRSNNYNIDIDVLLTQDSISHTLLVTRFANLVHASIARPTLAIDYIRAEEPPLPIPRH
jgi:hypothetical protein